ncbi:hypothetical protein QBC34DRAFT_15105 [Podospora aff. communis PSN243]|uniref:RRM domain-containing protein n=1 Tax=Podospora aff. communis PSN243 TaxID=3040156 RepID=A0AAV9H780_9PEZI|nr:hypothetical protein QBC34DRAFT_15105 [Podospora aff. communis PSN243]
MSSHRRDKTKDEPEVLQHWIARPGKDNDGDYWVHVVGLDPKTRFYDVKDSLKGGQIEFIVIHVSPREAWSNPKQSECFIRVKGFQGLDRLCVYIAHFKKGMQLLGVVPEVKATNRNKSLTVLVGEKTAKTLQEAELQRAARAKAQTAFAGAAQGVGYGKTPTSPTSNPYSTPIQGPTNQGYYAGASSFANQQQAGSQYAGQQYAGQYAAQQYAGQQYADQYAAQQYAGQQSAGQPAAGQYAGQQVAAQYAGQQVAGQGFGENTTYEYDQFSYTARRGPSQYNQGASTSFIKQGASLYGQGYRASSSSAPPNYPSSAQPNATSYTTTSKPTANSSQTSQVPTPYLLIGGFPDHLGQGSRSRVRSDMRDTILRLGAGLEPPIERGDLFIPQAQGWPYTYLYVCFLNREKAEIAKGVFEGQQLELQGVIEKGKATATYVNEIPGLKGKGNEMPLPVPAPVAHGSFPPPEDKAPPKDNVPSQDNVPPPNAPPGPKYWIDGRANKGQRHKDARKQRNMERERMRK